MAIISQAPTWSGKHANTIFFEKLANTYKDVPRSSKLSSDQASHLTEDFTLTSEAAHRVCVSIPRQQLEATVAYLHPETSPAVTEIFHTRLPKKNRRFKHFVESKRNDNNAVKSP